MASLTEPRTPKLTPSDQPKSKAIDDQEQASLIPPPPLPLHFSYSNRVLLKTILLRSDAGLGLVGQKMVIGGWVRSYKEIMTQPMHFFEQPADDSSPANREATCIEILQTRVPLFRSIAKIFSSGGSAASRARLDSAAANKPPPTNSTPSLPSIVNLLVSDGSCAPSLQVRIEFSDSLPFQPLPTGTSILAEGVLNRLQGESKQSIEFKVEKLVHVGTVEQNKYPLSKKRLPLESLRDCPHFRPRTTTVATVMRIRSSLSFGTHAFFQNHEFFGTDMPILTSTDSLGFSEKFRVITMGETKGSADTESVKLDGFKAAMKEKTNLIEQLKRTESNREALFAAEQDLLKTSQLAAQLEAKQKLQSQTSKPKSVDFFSNNTYLTVSGMLHLESYCCALGNVYCFGPRFRADRNASPKHLAEVWMVEAQMAYSQLEDAMKCAEDYFRFLCKWVLNNCEEDMKFAAKRIDRNKINFLEAMSHCSYERTTYTNAVEILEKVTDKKFETQPEWGSPLTPQHLSYLADEIYKAPLMVYNYPKGVKPFYARLNDDAKTVAAFDFVVPRGGILITGCQNEERVEIIEERMREVGLAKEQYEWYIDLRRHGTVKHSGFSMGFDLMVMFASGIPDVRDAIPFPRTPGTLSN